MGIDKQSKAQGCLLGQLAGDALETLCPECFWPVDVLELAEQLMEKRT